ncbi:Flagellar motor switch protein FliM [Lacunisphaera limnophila]|uniref:Flagellar motor switch protein FliM n=1 Tax=Lacunisphaera limnophila TaxID=1838286 RepID=A0A1D8AW40_9BACT|nr:FliM/FliN family flagellar motor switch protein [Lacunisphaera limnophila]AOS45118.1 Flagellar motor switch protein FliM [Lacunisphaera limnophila]
MAEDPNKAATDFLDQSEIDKLLAQGGAGDSALAKRTLIRADGRRTTGTDVIKVEPYDFRNPAFLSEVELRRLRLVHEDFIRYLSARLSLFLRMEFGLKMAKLTTVNYAKFTESLPSPTHICLFKAEPLTGVSVLDINPRLALTIADRLLGGRGHSVKTERYLTEIEVALLDDVVHMILEEWCHQWKNEQELTALIVGHENSGRFLQTSPKDAVVLAMTLEASFGDCSEQIQIGVPYYTIEPLVRKMQARRQKDANITTTVAKKASWQEAYSSIRMPVRAEWDTFSVSLREITDMRVGDVIEMPAEQIRQTNILLNGVPKFVGTAGLDAERVVVQLNAKISPDGTTAVSPLAPSSHGRKNP